MTTHPRRLIGNDDRKPANHAAICKLVYYGGEGTGFLCDRFTVITAAHCVLGVDVDSMEVHPGTNSEDSTPIKVKSMKAFTQDSKQQPSRDMAVIRLKSPVSLRQYIHLQAQPLSTSPEVSVCGYDLSGWKQQAGSSNATIKHGCFLYQLDTKEGQSGAPVLLNPSTAIGVHIGFESENHNRAAIITDEFIKFVSQP